MSTFAILLLCFQACLIQSVFGACGCGIKSSPASGIGYAAGPRYAGAGFGPASYNAVGSGDVAVFGDLDVNGATTVLGSVPVLGGLSFAGLVPASGLVTITGNCAYPQPAYYDAGIVGAELAGFNVGEIVGFNAGLAGATGAIASAEFAGFNGWAGAVGANAAAVNAELAGINAALDIQQWNNLAAWPKPACGSDIIYY